MAAEQDFVNGTMLVSFAGKGVCHLEHSVRGKSSVSYGGGCALRRKQIPSTAFRVGSPFGLKGLGRNEDAWRWRNGGRLYSKNSLPVGS
jgi:hypothetical protein